MKCNRHNHIHHRFPNSKCFDIWWNNTRMNPRKHCLRRIFIQNFTFWSVCVKYSPAIHPRPRFFHITIACYYDTMSFEDWTIGCGILDFNGKTQNTFFRTICCCCCLQDFLFPYNKLVIQLIARAKAYRFVMKIVILSGMRDELFCDPLIEFVNNPFVQFDTEPTYPIKNQSKIDWKFEKRFPFFRLPTWWTLIVSRFDKN